MQQGVAEKSKGPSISNARQKSQFRDASTKFGTASEKSGVVGSLALESQSSRLKEVLSSLVSHKLGDASCFLSPLTHPLTEDVPARKSKELLALSLPAQDPFNR